VGVAKDREETIRCYERADAAGCSSAADCLEESLRELDDIHDDDDDGGGGGGGGGDDDDGGGGRFLPQ
jgi:hypothetical protein